MIFQEDTRHSRQYISEVSLTGLTSMQCRRPNWLIQERKATKQSCCNVPYTCPQCEELQEELCTGCSSQAVQQNCIKAWVRSKFFLLTSKDVRPLSNCVGFLRKQGGNAFPHTSCIDVSLLFRDFHIGE